MPDVPGVRTALRALRPEQLATLFTLGMMGAGVLIGLLITTVRQYFDSQ